jgi:hypothetical protein
MQEYCQEIVIIFVFTVEVGHARVRAILKEIFAQNVINQKWQLTVNQKVFLQRAIAKILTLFDTS